MSGRLVWASAFAAAVCFGSDDAARAAELRYRADVLMRAARYREVEPLLKDAISILKATSSEGRDVELSATWNKLGLL
jgi:hypothetical protein